MLDQSQWPYSVPTPPAAPSGISGDLWTMLWYQAHLLPGLERWLLEHGTVFPTCELAPSLGTPRECFKNAGALAIEDPDLLYCEGLAASAKVPLMLPHAWLVDRQGRALEVTWAEPGQAYFGAVFQTSAYIEALEETRVWGIFDIYAPAWVRQEPTRWKHPAFAGLGLQVPRHVENKTAADNGS